jgi:GNAT superfamily N-acetyltransferase
MGIGESKNMTNELNIRFAEEKDTLLILNFIRSIAEYEKLSDKVVSTEEMIKKYGFSERKYFEVIIADYKNNPAGFALFFHNYSTFVGKPGLYLEDLFVNEKFRGMGIGKALLVKCAQIAVERGCERFEWSVLNWNPAKEFYEYLGAESMNEWLIYRIQGEKLIKLSENDK